MNQGLWGALEQFWTIEPKARLHRRNSWFAENEPSHHDLVLGLYVAVIVTILFIVFVMVRGLF